MIKTIYKLFGIKLLEIENYSDEEEKPITRVFRKTQGEVLEYSPEEYQKDKDNKIVNKMEGK